MPIKEPKITVALTTNDDRTDLVVRRNDGNSADQELCWVRINLHDAEREGHHALSQRIGTVALNMLIQAHSDEFAKYPLLVPPDLSSFERLRGLVLELISRSTLEKTSAYVPALDAIFAHNAADLTQTNLLEMWPDLRLGFLRYDRKT